MHTGGSRRAVLLLQAFTLTLLLSGLSRAQAATGTWSYLSEPINGTAVLLTDGRVMVLQDQGTACYALKPDASGNYANGTWTQLASMNDSRLYYASVVLPDGRVFVGGGEYGSGTSNVEMYDPVANTWTRITSWPGGDIGDSTAKVLPDGRVLLLPRNGGSWFYDPASDVWTAGSGKGGNDEQSVTQMGDGNFIVPWDGSSQKFISALNQWVAAATPPNGLIGAGSEIGPAVLLYDGRVFCLGANGNTDFYIESSNPTDPGTFVAGPGIPSGLMCDDAPAAVMPNGNVLFVADVGNFNGPSTIFEFDPNANTYTNAGGPAGSPCFTYRMLVLPTGQIFFPENAQLYTPSGGPNPSWQPAIASVVHNSDGSCTVSGTQLNGRTEGAYYGDDAQMSTNYPIIRLVNGSGTVFYAKSFNFSTMGVATGNATVSAQFSTSGIPQDTYSLYVVASGIASAPVSFTLGAQTVPPTITAQPQNVSVTAGQTASFSIGASGSAPLQFQWLKNGSAISGANSSNYTTPATSTADNGAAFACVVSNSAGSVTSNAATLTVAAKAESPYGGTPWPIPGTIQAENYDNGGEGVAYHDTTAGNTGGAYRSDDVDIRACSDSGGGYQVGWTDTGEWLNYTVNVAAAGSYTVSERIAAGVGGGALHVESDGANLTGTVSVPNTGGWDTWQTLSQTVNLPAGQHILRVFVETGGFDMNYFSFATSESAYGGTPWPIPGTIQAENYDNGGEGVAYHDTSTGNTGGAYRSDDVDIRACSDSGGGYQVGWTDAGEWLNYTVNVAATGPYTVSERIAAGVGGGALHVEFDGANLTGTVSVPNTGGWDTWQTLSQIVNLQAGQHILRVFVETGGFDMNYFSFATSESAYGGTPWPIPGTIQAENYDNGGEGVAYHDTTAGNTGGAYRSDDVDIRGCSDSGGGYQVGWTDAGEWLNYTVNVAAAGTYTVNERIAAGVSGGALHVEFDGANLTGSVSVPYTGSWDTWQTLSQTVNLPAGQHILRVFVETGGFDMNYFSFSSSESAYGGTPWPIPGRIQAEDYDNGGEGVAYHDTSTGNTGGAYRSDDVDIRACSDNGGGYQVGWTDTGEWLNYTVNVAAAGSYTVNERIAAGVSGGALHVEFDGANLTGSVSVPYTGSWDTWQTLSQTVNLQAGQHIMRVFVETGGFDMNYFQITSGAALANKQPAAAPVISSAASASPNPAQAGGSITFAAAASGSTALTYAWDFGDGSAGSGATVVHAYASAGTYTATVSVSDANGQTISSSTTVVVAENSVNSSATPPGAGAQPIDLGSVKFNTNFKVHLPESPAGKVKSAATGLPRGARVSGVYIGGRPKAAGTFTITVQFETVAHSAGSKHTATVVKTTQTYAITVVK